MHQSHLGDPSRYLELGQEPAPSKHPLTSCRHFLPTQDTKPHFHFIIITTLMWILKFTGRFFFFFCFVLNVVMQEGEILWHPKTCYNYFSLNVIEILEIKKAASQISDINIHLSKWLGEKAGLFSSMQLLVLSCGLVWLGIKLVFQI